LTLIGAIEANECQWRSDGWPRDYAGAAACKIISAYRPAIFDAGAVAALSPQI